MDKLSAKDKKAFEEWLETGKRISKGSFVPKETEPQKRKRITKLLKPGNFEKFIKFYFENDDTQFAPLSWFHKEAIENVFEKKLRKHLWEWHREAAKSVFADIFIPIYKLCQGDLTGLILASETEDKAKNLIKDVENQLRNNQRLINDFGNFGITGTWLQSFFQTKDGIGFWSFGLGQNPAGVRNGFLRPNLGIVDDADNKEKAKNQKLTKARVDWIKGEFMGCLAKDDRCFIYLNNRVHKEGITAHIAGDIEEDMPLDTSYAHIKAYLIENPKTHAAIFPDWADREAMLAELRRLGAMPAWHQYYSLEDAVDKLIDYGYINAQRQLFHNHIIEGEIFTDENMPWVQCLPLAQYDKIVTYCDPAFGDSGKGCFRAVGLIGLTNKYYDVIDVWMERHGSFARAHHRMAMEIEKGGAKFYDPNNPKVVVREKVSCPHWVESNNLQRKVLRYIYAELNQSLKVAWYPRFDMDAKGDKVGRIETLEPLANNGYLRFNVAKRKDRHMIILRNQFKEFPHGLIDGPDMVEGGISKLRRSQKKTYESPQEESNYQVSKSRSA